MELSFSSSSPDAKNPNGQCTVTDVHEKKKKGVNINLGFFRLKFGGKRTKTTTIECQD